MVAQVECLKTARDENSNLHILFSRNSHQQKTTGIGVIQQNAQQQISTNKSAELADEKTKQEELKLLRQPATEEVENEESTVDKLYPLHDWIIKQTDYIFRGDLQDQKLIDQCIHYNKTMQCPISNFLVHRNVPALIPLPDSVLATDPYRPGCSGRFASGRFSPPPAPYFAVPYEPGYIHDPRVPYEQSPIIRLVQSKQPQYPFPIYISL